MKRQMKICWFRFLIWGVMIAATGCSTGPKLIMPESLPPIVKSYRHVTINAYHRGDEPKGTGVHLSEGDLYSVFSTRKESLVLKIGDGKKEISQSFPAIANQSGNLSVGYIVYGKEPVNGGLEIIIWREEDYERIAAFLAQLMEKAPEDADLKYAYEDAVRLKKFQDLSKRAIDKIAETQREIQVLAKKPLPGQTEETAPPPIVDPKLLAESNTAGTNAPTDAAARMEARLAKLSEVLSQLETMKRELETERKKAGALAEKLEEKEARERDLLARLESSAKKSPVIVIASPKTNIEVDVDVIRLVGVAEDDKGLREVHILVNGKPADESSKRGIIVAASVDPKRVDLKSRIHLQQGMNRIRIQAVDSDGIATEREITINNVSGRKKVWAVVVGINDYTQSPKLKYAVNDAMRFYQFLIDDNRIPRENVTLILDQEATLTRLRSVLGTHLKSKAGKDDMVIIFFAGHGATEKDAMSPDGDGLEKYLLPYDAAPDDLYATALPMGEISRIFDRIRSERLIFIADSCYSGASGGRTIGVSGIRANISDAFLDRITQGKGRVILSASAANEVSAELDAFEDGVFTHFLIKGLKGKADFDQDGAITVDEIYKYVSAEVPKATGQEQHPIKKGTVEGQLVLGIAR